MRDWSTKAAQASVPSETLGSPFSRRQSVLRPTNRRAAMSAVDHPIDLSFPGTDRCVDQSKSPLVTVVDPGPLRGGRPAAANPHHPFCMRFALRPQSDPAAANDFRNQSGCQRCREFLFHASGTSGLLLGWRVSGATFRHFCRARVGRSRSTSSPQAGA